MTETLKIDYDRYPCLEVAINPKQDHIEIMVKTPMGSFLDPMRTTLKATATETYYGDFLFERGTCTVEGVRLANGTVAQRVTQLKMPCQPIAAYMVYPDEKGSILRSDLSGIFTGSLIQALVVEQDGKPVEPQWVQICASEHRSGSVDAIYAIVNSYLTNEGVLWRLVDAISGHGKPFSAPVTRCFFDSETGKYVSEEAVIAFDGESIHLPAFKWTGVVI